MNVNLVGLISYKKVSCLFLVALKAFLMKTTSIN